MKIQLQELPRTLDKEVSAELANYSVAIFSYKGADGSTFKLHGSGTLVTRDGRFGILTAHHCLHQCRPAIILGGPSDHQLVFVLRGSRQIVVGTGELVEHELALPKSGPWGPDLTFIEIPAGPRLLRFKAVGSFWSLDRRPAEVLKEFALPNTCMVCIGHPAVEQQTEVKDGHFVTNRGKTHAFLGILKRGGYSRKGTWDYAQIIADYDSSPTLPSTFGGVSGGGFWAVKFKKTKENIRVDRICFMGVAFYQTALRKGKRRIRAQFVRSIYEEAWRNVASRET